MHKDFRRDEVVNILKDFIISHGLLVQSELPLELALDLLRCASLIQSKHVHGRLYALLRPRGDHPFRSVRQCHYIQIYDRLGRHSKVQDRVKTIFG